MNQRSSKISPLTRCLTVTCSSGGIHLAKCMDWPLIQVISQTAYHAYGNATAFWVWMLLILIIYTLIICEQHTGWPRVGILVWPTFLWIEQLLTMGLTKISWSNVRQKVHTFGAWTWFAPGNKWHFTGSAWICYSGINVVTNILVYHERLKERQSTWKMVLVINGSQLSAPSDSQLTKFWPRLDQDFLINVVSVGTWTETQKHGITDRQYSISTYDTYMYHEKTDLKVFVFVIPKEGLAVLWVWHDYKMLLYCLHRLYFVVGVLFGYDNDKDLKVFFLMMRHMAKSRDSLPEKY